MRRRAKTGAGAAPAVRVSPVAWGLIGVVAVGVVLTLLASGTPQKAGFVVGVIALVALVGGAPLGRWGGGWTSHSGLYEEPAQILDEAPPDPLAWKAERERREERGR